MPDETRPCPICGETILAVAKKCRHCREYLDPQLKAEAEGPSSLERFALPVGRPTSAIVAGYAGLFAIVPLLGFPAAVAAVWGGTVALKKIKNTPGLSGRGRAWFGIVMGAVMLSINLIWILALVAAIAAEGS